MWVSASGLWTTPTSTACSPATTWAKPPSASLLAEIVSPMTGNAVEEIRAKDGGVIFFTRSKALVNERTLVFTVIPNELDVK